MIRLLTTTLLFLSGFSFAIDLKPWYARSLQLYGSLDYRFQSYASVDAPSSQKKYSSDDHFLDANLSIVFDPYSIQVESVWADTRKRNFDWDHLAISGRYLWLDDDIGDPFSFNTGITLSRAWKEAVNDISSFHHGQNEAFFHASLGKQEIVGSSWLTRWWTVLGIGIADRWTPWIVANASYEWNQYDPHRLRLYINSLWGCGTKKLDVCDFGGYGPIDHRSIDVGFRYSYEFDYWGFVFIDYARRMYAHNYPDNTNLLTISYIYPFGPEGDYYILKAYHLLTGKKTPF